MSKSHKMRISGFLEITSNKNPTLKKFLDKNAIYYAVIFKEKKIT
jgi:hypothetical protein